MANLIINFGGGKTKVKFIALCPKCGSKKWKIGTQEDEVGSNGGSSSYYHEGEPEQLIFVMCIKCKEPMVVIEEKEVSEELRKEIFTMDDEERKMIARDFKLLDKLDRGNDDKDKDI